MPAKVKVKEISIKRLNERKRNQGLYEQEYLGGVIATLRQGGDVGTSKLAKELISEQGKRLNEISGDSDICMVLDHVVSINDVPVTKEYLEDLSVKDFERLKVIVLEIEIGIKDKLTVFRDEMIKIMSSNSNTEKLITEMNELYRDVMLGEFEKKTSKGG